MFGSFGEDATAIESVVNDFSYRGRVRIYIHSITRTKMANDPLGGNFQSDAG